MSQLVPVEQTPEINTKTKSKGWRLFFRILRRTLLVILVVVVLAVAAAAMACHTIFNGPSDEAREKLFFCFDEPSGTKWIPGLFLSEEQIRQIREKPIVSRPTADVSSSGQVQIKTDSSLSGDNDEWKDHPDGIRIERISGDTYTAHVMIIRDPSQVYLSIARKDFSKEKPGVRINTQMNKENAIAGINAGAFYDDGKSSPEVGTVPEGLVVAGGEVVWNDHSSYNGFAGFNEDDILVVAKSMSAKQAKELNIRDGCCFGPVLIMDGNVNAEVYNASSGLNPRTCIGQRADGAVIFLCIDGRQANSLGGTYADCTDIMVEYGAVNACNLDGGSSTIMYYRDTYGLYGEAGELAMINNYSLLRSQPRAMPTFFMVRPAQEEGQ